VTTPPPRPGVLVVASGWGTTIQDHGRVGFAHLGVPTAGAVDRPTHDLVNRLVGNDPGAATVETLGGLVVEATTACVVARSTDASRHVLAAGERLRVDPAPGALWAYLAVRGGIDVAPVLGSRSHDTLAGVGPPPVRDGSALAAGADPGGDLGVELVPRRLVTGPLRVWPGPHARWFADGVDALAAGEWTVSAEVSRVGARLVARPLVRARDDADLPSAGLVPGAIQITPSGEPIVMLANHPTTGGYPVIAVVDPDDLARLAQSPPGTRLNFSVR
jgi:biotin-dependent carboxylase-like uncharacterized protein